MRKLFSLFVLFGFLCSKAGAQQVFCPPPNIGFENGTMNGWACDTGMVDPSGKPVLIPSVPVYNRQVLIDSSYAPQLDPWGNFPTLCPFGGRFSIRLGNQEAGKGCERVSYTFTVPPSSDEYDLIFYYAVVLQNPPHLSFQQPRFTVKTFDVTDSAYVTCGSFDFIASADLPGFKPSPQGDTVFYKDWAPSTMHLKGFAGKQVRLEFTTNDCTLGRHFGYAYLDVNENCGSLITGNVYCRGQDVATLEAPGGFGNYTWYNQDFSKQVGQGQLLSLSPPPPDGTRYAVVVTPYFGLGCTDTLYTTVSRDTTGFVFKVKDSVAACAGGSVDLTAPSVTEGSSSDLTFTYSKDVEGLEYIYQPKKVDSSGIYFITAVSPKGCTGVLPVRVSIGNPQIVTTDPAPVDFPATIDLSATFVRIAGNTYSYYLNSEATAPVADYHHIAHSGTYYIKATNTVGCTTIKPVEVVVNPPPPPEIEAVNAFTPNNDGINDYFSVKLTGYARFNSLRIYNRYGQMVFETFSADAQWDGRFNNQLLPPGTYYWIFNGTNTYYNSKLIRSGYIALIR